MLHTKSQAPTTFDYDLVCLGSGSAGGSAAMMVASGRRVAIVEGGFLGGACPNTSCVPVNALLQTVKTLAAIYRAPTLGISATRVHCDWSQIIAFKDECVRKTGVGKSQQAFEKAGISVIKGFAKFVDPWTISVNQQQIKASRFIVATGTKNFVPKITGLNKIDFLTYQNIFNLKAIPKSLLIIGGGMTGCAMAEIFNSLGSRVYLVDKASNLLQRENAEIGQVQAEIFKNKGVHVLLNQQLTKIEKPTKRPDIDIAMSSPDGEKKVTVEKVLVACGKEPNIDLNLDAAGVQFDATGVKVNRHLQTTASHIYALGDVVGHDMSAQLAVYHSRLAIHNLLHSRDKDKIGYNYLALPRHLALTPEIAACGFTEAELRSKQISYHSALIPLSDIDHSYLSGETAGFVKMMCSHTGQLLGASLIAPTAGEMINQVTLAMNANLTVSDLKNNATPLPSWSVAFNLAASKLEAMVKTTQVANRR